jgi:hypothetical protein
LLTFFFVYNSVANPDLRFGVWDPGSVFFYPWIQDPYPEYVSRIWDGKNPDPNPRFGMNIQDHFSESLETVLWVKILLCESGSGIRDLFEPWIWDPGWKNLDLGSGINILDFQHWSSSSSLV